MEAVYRPLVEAVGLSGGCRPLVEAVAFSRPLVEAVCL